jgi:hypothetical protein
MTKQTRPSDPSTAPTPFSAAAWANGPMLDALMRTGEACNKACRAWQEEAVRFTTARLESDIELGRKLFTCGNWTEAAKLQQDWVVSMAQDYLNEANRIVQLSSELGTETMRPVAPESRHGAKERKAHSAA